MAEYVMTPARRAALRKAQLISAQRRRSHTVAGYALHSGRQKVAIAYREGQLQHYRNAPQRQLQGQKVKALPGKAAKAGTKYAAKKALKSTAKAGLTLGAATAIGYTAYGMTPRGQVGQRNRRIRRQDISANKHLWKMKHSARYYSHPYSDHRRTPAAHIKSSRGAAFGTKIKALPRGR